MNDRLPIIRNYFDTHPLKQDQGTCAAQKLVSLLLKELNEICEREGISYFLYGGCLIGAVRHGGYIPWDDDIDIVMTSKDLEKLEKAIDGSKYGVTVPKWLHKFKRNDIPALVDILPAMDTRSNLDEHQCRRQFFIMREVGLTYHKTSLSKTIEDALSESYNQPGGKNRYISTKICNPYNNNYRLSGIPYDRVYPLRKVKLCGVDAFIPNDPEYLLSLQFGGNYDIPMFRKGSHVSHKAAVSYCLANGIDIVGKNKVVMSEEYSKSMKGLYSHVKSNDELQHSMIAALLEYYGIGTKKNPKSALKRLEARFPEVSGDPFYVALLYDILCTVGGAKNLEKADKLAINCDPSDPGMLMRRGKTAIRRKDNSLYKSVLNDMAEVDLAKAVALVDAVMDDKGLLESLDPYECCCSMAESGFRNALVYKTLMEAYGIHCKQSVDIALMNTISATRGIRDLFYDLLWKLRAFSPRTFFLICSCMTADLSMRYGYLGRAYRDGIGVDVDLGSAAVCMKKAADTGQDWTRREYFEILWNTNTPESLETMVEFAGTESSMGDPYIRAGMARAYHEGKGVEKDLGKAADLARLSMKRGPGYIKGEYVDILLETGTPEAERAAFEFVHSVKGRARNAMNFREARMYRDGIGVEKDLGKAVEYMRKAVDAGVKGALYELMEIFWNMGTPEADAEMVALARERVKMGSAISMGWLGRAYRDGRGVEKSSKEAREWYRKAAKEKVVWAKEELERLK